MFKQWILKKFFSKELGEAIRQGNIDAFVLAHKDILDTMQDDLNAQAEVLAKEKVATLLSVVDPTHIISWDKRTGIVKIGGERATEGQLGNLKSEAEYLSMSNLWKILYESPKQLAYINMFKEGDSIEFMRKGRSMLFTLETQKEIVELLKSYQQPQN